ncbi:MAG TPA: hypothetical protein VJ461_02225 [Candidatus Nanoarchaeia archaeon]|nr:hypothetical protein [Candidatus Nanoarchaeia archaeon]
MGVGQKIGKWLKEALLYGGIVMVIFLFFYFVVSRLIGYNASATLFVLLIIVCAAVGIPDLVKKKIKSIKGKK